jgi:hypothetical protein
MIVRRLKNDELYHHGIKGQKWGVRRYQNPDGSLTSAGKRRLYRQNSKDIKAYKKAEYGGADRYNMEKDFRKSISKEDLKSFKKSHQRFFKAEMDIDDLRPDDFESNNGKVEKLSKEYNESEKEVNTIVNKIAKEKLGRFKANKKQKDIVYEILTEIDFNEQDSKDYYKDNGFYDDYYNNYQKKK